MITVLRRGEVAADLTAALQTRDRDRKRFAFIRMVPDDILLLVLGYCGASSLLALETASRALLELLRSPARHKQQEALWCGCLRSRWPREGPALCSLGDNERRLGLRPRAPARQIYRAFCVKKNAKEDIENVVAPGEDALEELAFIAVVGDFAGLASWDEETDPSGLKRGFLRWQPPEVRLGRFENLEAYEQGQATVAELTLEPEKTCDEARPSLFELVTRTGRAAFGRVVADGAPERRVGAAEVINQTNSERSAVQQSPPTDSPTLRPVAEAVTASVAMAAEAVELVPTPETVAVSEEAADADDLLDIPAFLRRQAN